MYLHTPQQFFHQETTGELNRIISNEIIQLTHPNIFHLTIYYTCPIINKNIILNDSFIQPSIIYNLVIHFN